MIATRFPVRDVGEEVEPAEPHDDAAVAVDEDHVGRVLHAIRAHQLQVGIQKRGIGGPQLLEPEVQLTEELLTELSKSFPIEEITLHVGLGTFAPLTDKHLSTGKLHQEYFEINDRSLAAIYAAKHITAVGTTTVRTLETIFGRSGQKTHGYTDILIRAGYDFRRVDAMITNFHLPSTSLLMLVAAFIADKKNLDEAEAAKELMRVYKHAIRKRYRFYSFGDAMLLV